MEKLVVGDCGGGLARNPPVIMPIQIIQNNIIKLVTININFCADLSLKISFGKNLPCYVFHWNGSTNAFSR